MYISGTSAFLENLLVVGEGMGLISIFGGVNGTWFRLSFTARELLLLSIILLIWLLYSNILKLSLGGRNEEAVSFDFCIVDCPMGEARSGVWILISYVSTSDYLILLWPRRDFIISPWNMRLPMKYDCFTPYSLSRWGDWLTRDCNWISISSNLNCNCSIWR
jgi:hypothetical protein